MQQLDVIKTETGDTGGNVIAVSVKATTDCTFLTWPVEGLIRLLEKNAQLKAPLGMIIGADVARKLIKQTGRTSQSFHELQALVKSVKSEKEALGIFSKEKVFSKIEEQASSYFLSKASSPVTPEVENAIHQLLTISKSRRVRIRVCLANL